MSLEASNYTTQISHIARRSIEPQHSTSQKTTISSDIKIPGELVSESVDLMSATQEAIHRSWMTFGEMVRPFEEMTDSITRPYSNRLKALAKGTTTPKNLWEVYVGLSEVAIGSGVSLWKNWLDSFYFKPIRQASKGSRMLEEAKTAKLEGITPYQVIATDGFAELNHFFKSDSEKSSTETKNASKPAVVFIFPPMNRWQIMDPDPKRSFVKAMVDANFDFYLINFGGEKLRAKEPGWEKEKHRTLDRTVLKTIPDFIQTAAKTNGSKDIHLISYCLGSPIMAAYLALQPEIQPDINIKSAIEMTPPQNFTKKGLNNLFKNAEMPILDVASIIAADNGVMRGDVVNWGALLRDPAKYVVEAEVGAYKIAGETDTKKIDTWKFIAAWLAQPVDFAGEMWYQIGQEILRDNKLVKNEMILEDEGISYQVDLRNVRIPVLQQLAGKDDIVAIEHSSKDDFPNAPVTREIYEDQAHVSLPLNGGKNGFFKRVIDWVRIHSTPVPQTA